MTPPSGPVVARFEPIDEFQSLYRRYKDNHPGIVEAFHAFVRCKIERPPAELPRILLGEEN